MYKYYIVTREGSIISKKTGKQIYVHVNKKGYNFIRLYDKGKGKTHLVHRVVADLHVPNPLNLPEVNHKDGNKSNNNHWNLEWCTRQQNVDHSIKAGLTNNSGIKHYKCKLSQETIDSVREMFSTGVDCAAIGREYGISQASSYRICHYQSHK